MSIADSANYRVRRVGVDGVINTVAGSGVTGFAGDGGPATAGQLGVVFDAAVAPDGSLYIAHGPPTGSVFPYGRIRRVAPPSPGFSLADIVIPSADGSEIYIFDSSGRHQRTLHALTGAVLYRFTYDSAGRLKQIVDGDNNTTTVERDSNGKPVAIVAPFGQRTTLDLDPNGYLASVTNPASEQVRMTYSDDGPLKTFTDARGNTYRMTYDADGRLINEEDPAGGYKRLTRTETADGYEISLTTGLGRVTKHRVDRLPTGNERRVNTFPDATQSDVLIGQDGSYSAKAVDAVTTLTVQAPDPRFSMQAPIAKSRVTTMPSGLSQTITTGRSVTMRDPNDLLSLTSLSDTVAIRGRTATSLYDAATRTFTKTSPAGRTATNVIDALGRITLSSMPEVFVTNVVYDDHGRLSSISQGAGTEERATSYTYTALGYLDTVTDALGRTARFEHDAAGRITRQILTDGRDVQFEYDVNGNLTAVLPPGRPPHLFHYNVLDLKDQYVPPNVGAGSNSTIYSYNLDQQLTRITRPDGGTLDYTYDSAGRLSQLMIPDGTYSLRYEQTTGKLIQMTAPDGGTLAFAYDGALWTSTTWAGTVAGTVGFAYDNDFRVTNISVNGANPVTYRYDVDSLPIQVGDLNLSRSSANGLLMGTSLGGVSDGLAYDGFGEATRYAALFDATPLFAADYTYDKLGRITKKVEAISGVASAFEYTYDLAGRLIEVKLNGASTSAYTYDANGNRLSHLHGGTVANGTYDDQDRLLSYGGNTYTYTANGELNTKTMGGQTTAYRYDILGNLLAVTLSGGTQIEYIVDARNRRIGKKVNGAIVQRLLYQDGLKPIAELDGSNNVRTRFVYGTRINVPDYMVTGGQTYRIVSDHLGSPRLVINVADGTIAQRMDYDEFGRVITDTNPGFQPFGFAGGLYDPQTGLVRLGARDYDAASGHWTSKDPIGFGGGTNLYRYVLNDPINLRDPNGTQARLTPEGDWVPVFPPVPDWHSQRNAARNYCPSSPPQQGVPDCTGRVFNDWGDGKYRAQDGSECHYNGYGELDGGTFNYEPDPITLGHGMMDVWPDLQYGRDYQPYVPQQYTCNACGPNTPSPDNPFGPQQSIAPPSPGININIWGGFLPPAGFPY